MSVLLSHISEEAHVASVLAQWIESSLDRDVHLSGETDAVQVGAEQLAEVDRAVAEAQIVLLLCSGRSIGRPWIAFESGCAWVNHLPVVAVCHAGCSTADLRPPLGSFRTFNLTDAASCQALLENLASHLQRKRVPRIDYDRMVAEIGAAADQSQASAPSEVHQPAAARPSNGQEAPAARHPSPATARPIEVRLLAVMKREPDYSCTATSLAETLGERERELRDVLNKLLNDHLLTQRVSIHPTDPDARYALSDKGRSYLARHGR